MPFRQRRPVLHKETIACEHTARDPPEKTASQESAADQDKSTELAKQFRTHLLGLYRSLEQMTEAANYLTARYQSDVGPV